MFNYGSSILWIWNLCYFCYWLCSKIWNQILIVTPPVLFFLLRIASNEFYYFSFVFLWRRSLGISLNLETAFNNITIFTTLILPILEYEKAFHLLIFSSMAFFSFKFSLWKGLSLSWLDYFCVFLKNYYNWNCFPDFFLSACYCYIEKLLTFVYWFCTLLLC